MGKNRVVMAEYFTSEDRTFLFITRADFAEPQVVEIQLAAEEMRQFVTHKFSVSVQGGSNVSQLDLREWHTNFYPFIAPILEWADEGDIIWLIPHDVLHYLPLHAIQVDGHYLIERNPVCYTPSATVMKFCQQNRKARRGRALVMGDPLDDLLFAREEALAIANLFGTAPHLGRKATKTCVKEMLNTRRNELDIVHFSCHGYFHPVQVLKSGIMLASEEQDQSNEEQWNLTAEELFNQHMSVNLVTLSACDTGINEHKPGDELIGLTRALIYAGTPSVIVSLWAVDDLSTNLLMQHFYQQLRDTSITKVEALQQAQLYVQRQTAQEIVYYCNQRIADVEQAEESERAIAFLLGRVKAQMYAGDLPAAQATYRQVEGRLHVAIGTQTSKLLSQIREALTLLEFIAEESSQQGAVNYEVKPFEHPYYWAPFVLYSQWPRPEDSKV